ncbi:MAG: FliM/FliN family flagellar motor C-terminal domain-containing protein, partial [Candidatus Eisenbacteria bacterium]|nr:FliM/FliN family flagellar motor C-terminal domain-containing protein [Candidatus Eisenbacteria bacterium]
LAQVRLTVDARLPRFVLSAREVASLHPGRTIDTGIPADALLEVRLNGSLRYLAAAGRDRKQLAVRIVQAIPASGPPQGPRARKGRVS